MFRYIFARSKPFDVLGSVNALSLTCLVHSNTICQGRCGRAICRSGTFRPDSMDFEDVSFRFGFAFRSVDTGIFARTNTIRTAKSEWWCPVQRRVFFSPGTCTKNRKNKINPRIVRRRSASTKRCRVHRQSRRKYSRRFSAVRFASSAFRRVRETARSQYGLFGRHRRLTENSLPPPTLRRRRRRY